MFKQFFSFLCCMFISYALKGEPILSDIDLSSKPALILYDTNSQIISNGYLYSVFLANLLGHFHKNYRIQPIESYVSSQINQFEPIFYLGTIYNNPLPLVFLNDVIHTSHTVVWFGYNLWQLSNFFPDFSEVFGFIYEYIDRTGYNEIRYKNKIFSKNESDIEHGKIHIIHPNIVKIWSVAINPHIAPNESIPYIVQSHKLWYFADIPFTFIDENNRYLVLADLLYDILNIEFISQKRALIRLEDIDPTYDTNILRDIADYLYAEKVPFSMAVIPYYIDPFGMYNRGQPQFVKMTDRPEFIETLKYMISKGGSLIIHGYTHQYNQVANPYFGISGSDYEFYQIKLDSDKQHVIYQAPLSEDSIEWVQSRIAAAEALFKEAGFNVDVWETPHYRASLLDNQFFSRHFKAQTGRITYFDASDLSQLAEQFFPYIIYQDTYGNKIIPENLGCAAPRAWYNFSSRTVSDMLASAEKNLAIRDAWASACYHPFLGLPYLKKLIYGLKELGYEFVSNSNE